MPLPRELGAAKERILEALAALEAYIEGGHRDSAEHKQLAQALRDAINEFWNTLLRLRPLSWR